MTNGIGTKLANAFRRHGPLRSLRLVWKNFIYYMRRYIDVRFDRKFGVETVEKVDLGQLRISSGNKKYGVLYEPTPIRTFRTIIKNLPISAPDYIFVDYGCGKGRVVIEAIEQGFKKVVGVEFSPELCEIAARNLAVYRSRRGTGDNAEIYCMDAVEFEIPAVPCVLYLFNPFERPVLERVVENIKRSYESNPRKLFVVHYNPVNTDLFGSWDMMKKINTKETVFELAGPRERRFACYETSQCELNQPGSNGGLQSLDIVINDRFRPSI
jgi:SAM-dependent methyltransferase